MKNLMSNFMCQKSLIKKWWDQNVKYVRLKNFGSKKLVFGPQEDRARKFVMQNLLMQKFLDREILHQKVFSPKKFV